MENLIAIEMELRNITTQLTEINERLDNLGYLSELEEIASAIRRISPKSSERFHLPKPRK
jgi:hypothetical protein